MKKLVYILSIFLFSTCSNPTSGTTDFSAELGSEFPIKVGEAFTFKDSNLKLKLQNVNDFRCNFRDIVCVWSGDATIALLMNDEDVSINLYYPEDEQSIFQGYKIDFINLTPEIRTRENLQSAYTAILKVIPE